MKKIQAESKEWPKYRFYRDLVEYGGSCVFDLWAGEFEGDEAKEVHFYDDGYLHLPSFRNKAGTRYIGEDAFIVYLNILRSIHPEFDWYGGNHFDSQECADLLACLEQMQKSLHEAVSMEELKNICSDRLYGDDEPFEKIREKVVAMTEDFADIVRDALNRNVSLWMYGL